MKPKKKLMFDTVRKVGLALPDVQAGTAYGSPALKVKGQLLCCIAINRSAEPETLAVRVPFEQRDELIATDPATYYLTPHYADHPVVLARMSQLDGDALSGLLRAGWQFASSKGKRKRRADSRI